ncbi:hypothetical protein [Frigoriglobus tundricola]|uniref:Uncharacterized protein n=1 Tax=Frigoriglobus tundricola TaxID=2774151 RepID=A0A6M5YUJ5_9BACT|nr:hypothetical protein [Frigoriglobus tundricola]QJW97094.1 hypothetical protein FTUN_4659 [Frigoriglobus tundricola]
MSGRTVPRFALAGLLAAALAAPAVAQEGSSRVPPIAVAEAPMPRAKDALACDVLAYYDALYFACFSSFISSQDAPADAPKAEPVQPMAPPRPLEAAAQAPCCRTPAAANTNEDIRIEVQETRTGSFVVGGFNIAGPYTLQPGYRLELAYKFDPVARINSTQVMGAPVQIPTPPGTPPAQHVVTQPGWWRGDWGLVNPSTQTTTGPGTVRWENYRNTWEPHRSTQTAPSAAPACGGIPQPQVFTFGGAGSIQLVLADDATSAPCPLPKPAANPLLGTWYRDLGIGVMSVTFTPDEMKLCQTQQLCGSTLTVTVTAHYSITKDGLVYGAVTGADVDAKLDSKAEVGMELAEVSLMLQELTDHPFSFRTKMTSAGLMVSQVKAASDGQFQGRELATCGGLYKFAKDGRVPAPAVKAAGALLGARSEPALRPVVIPPTLPTVGEPLQRVGVDFTIDLPTVVTPGRPMYRVDMGEPLLRPVPFGDVVVPGRPVCNASAPPAPSVCSDPTKGLAADAFGQLLQQSGVQLPAGTFVDSLPQPREIAEPCYPNRYNAATQPMVAPFVGQPTSGTTIAKPAHMGTWYRDIGTKRCVVKIEADHLTVTVSEAQDCDGQAVTGDLVFTADYQLTRDGMTAVGLITSVDAKFDGDVSEDDMKSVMDMVADLQKALEEKPFAMTFRRYGEILVIGHVRMPEVGDRMEMQPSTYIGGRYKSVGDKPLSPLKAVKHSEPKSVCLPPMPVPPAVFAPPPPAGYGYGMPYPGAPRANAMPAPYAVYPPPATAAPSDLLPPQAVPCPAPPRPVEYQVPLTPVTRPVQPTTVPARQTESLPIMPAPQPMTAPAALPECSPTMSVPRPVALECAPAPHEIVKTGPSSRGQIINFSVGVFGNQ